MLRFNLLVLTIFSIILIILCLWLKLKKNKSSMYIMFFIIFYIYLLNVIKYTIFPIPIFSGLEAELTSRINIKPFVNMNSMEKILNIVLTIPFGFGISYVIKIKNKKKLGTIFFLIGTVIEMTQLLISLAIEYPYRSIDINDIICNFIGAVIGYVIFKTASYKIVSLIDKFELKTNKFMEYVYTINKENA